MTHFSQVKSFASGVGNGAVNFAKSIGSSIKSEATGLVNAYRNIGTNPIATTKYVLAHSGQAIIGKAVINNFATPAKIVNNIANGNYQKAGEAYGEHLAAAATAVVTDGAVRGVSAVKPL